MNKIFKSTVSKCFLYTVLVAFLMAGCVPEPTKEARNKYWNKEYKIIEIEKCEYIIIEASRLGFLAHKGNCKNH